MVLMPCRAADTGRGTELSEVLTAVSLSTPVIRKSTVGKIVMLPVRMEKKKSVRIGISFHIEDRIAMLIIFILALNLIQMHIAVYNTTGELEGTKKYS